jgi:hypothetical protein
MSVQVSYKKQFLLGILFLLVVLSVVEIVSRIALDVIDPRSSYCTNTVIESKIYPKLDKSEIKKLCSDYYSMKSYNLYAESYSYVENGPNQFTSTFNINDDGLRGPDIVNMKDENTYRVFILGGSTIFGQLSTSDSTTIPGYLEQEFSNLKSGYKIEVINAGIGGATSFHETELIKKKLIHYNPDLFIVYDGWNDLNYPVTVSNEGEIPLLYQIHRQISELDDYYKSPRFIDSVTTFLDSRIKEKLQTTDENSKESEITDASEKIKLWKSRWSEICKMGTENGFTTIITLQPVLESGDKSLTDWEKHALKKVEYRSVAPFYPDLRIALTELNSECTQTADLSNVFDEVNDTIFYDLGHMGDSGNILVAKKLYELSKPIVIENLK